MRRAVFVVFWCFVVVLGCYADDMLAGNLMEIPMQGAPWYYNTTYYTPGGRTIRTVGAEYTVRYVGYYDHGQDGLAIPYQAYIWTEDPYNQPYVSLITSVRIPGGTNAPLYAGCRWAKLDEPIVLPANTGFVAVAVGITSDRSQVTLDAKGGWLTNDITGSDTLKFGDHNWGFLCTDDGYIDESYGAISFPGSGSPQVSIGMNVASEIDIFDDVRPRLNVEEQEAGNCYEVDLEQPSPFYEYALHSTTNLINGPWVDVTDNNIALFATNNQWIVTNGVDRLYLKTVKTRID